MTPQEESRYHRRVSLFHQARGMQLAAAQDLAERLFDRDRNRDDRRSCAECANLRQRGYENEWGNVRQDAVGCWAGADVDAFEMLKRCDKFKWQEPTRHPEFFPIQGAA